MRFVAPQPVEGWLIVIVAGIALAVDVVTAVLTYALSKKSMNIRAAFLHNVADALGSIGVIVAGTLIILSRLAGGRSDRHADDRGLHPVAGLHRDRRRDPPHARHPARRNSSAQEISGAERNPARDIPYIKTGSQGLRCADTETSIRPKRDDLLWQ
jgi:Cation efflux family